MATTAFDVSENQARYMLGIGADRWLKLRGEPGFPARNAEGRLDARAVVDWWRELELAPELRALEREYERNAEELDESQERARYYAAKADQLEAANAKARGELVPAATLERVLARVISEVTNTLDGLPAQIKAALGHLRAGEVQLIRDQLARARNALARFELTHSDAA